MGQLRMRLSCFVKLIDLLVVQKSGKEVRVLSLTALLPSVSLLVDECPYELVVVREVVFPDESEQLVFLL